MKLPGGESAEVKLEKITDYLLAAAHPIGQAKARFFRGLGFREDRPLELRAALLEIARAGRVTDEVETPFGTKYVVEGELKGPGNASGRVRTVWITERGRKAPRLVTAYPHERTEEGS